MVVVMPAGVSVELRQGHEVVEVRIPSSWEVHAPLKGLIVCEGHRLLQASDCAIHLAAHPFPVVKRSSHAWPVVIDRMKRRRRRVEESRTGTADPIRQSAEQPHEDQQSLYDHV